MEWAIYEMEVPWHECDPAGIAFWGNYMLWVERAFQWLLAKRGYRCDGKSLLPCNVALPVTRVECRYTKPLPFGRKIKVAITFSRESDNSRLTTPFKIILDETGEMAAEGKVARRFVSLETFRPVECPDELKKVFGFD